MDTQAYYYPYLPPLADVVPSVAPKQEPVREALLAICGLMKKYAAPAAAPHVEYVRENYPSYSYPWGWHNRQVHHHHYEVQSEKKEKSNTLYIVAGVIFSAIGLASAYLIGKELGARQDLLDARDLVREHSIKTLDVQLGGYDALLKDTELFFQSRNSEAVRLLAAKVALFVGALVALTGCLIASSVLVGVGAVAAFIATCGWLVERGFEDSSKCREREAERIFKAAEDLLDRISSRASQRV